MRALVIGMILMLQWLWTEGAQAEVFTIEDFEDLEALSALVAQGEGPFRGEVYLMNDIEAERVFTPIGDAEHMFSGVFDGQGHAVSGLWIDGTGDFSGLFGFIGQEGIVRNLTVQNALVTGQRYCGAVAGYSAGRIECCSAEGGRIIGTSNYEYSVAVGGIVGLTSGEVEGCVNLDASVYGRRYVGGIAGSLCAGTIRRCLSEGKVFSWEKGEALVGGVVGAVQSGGEVRECIAFPEVFAEQASDAGGIAGGILSGTLSKCIFLGTVQSREAGAIAGYAARRAQVMGCIYEAMIGKGIGEGREDGTMPLNRSRVVPRTERLMRLVGWEN